MQIYGSSCLIHNMRPAISLLLLILDVLTKVTNLQPQRSFNWLTAEPITWMQIDGTIGHGLLYKPENFDPKYKYPIIFTYYEDGLSDNLFEHFSPDFTGGGWINIPWFVSRGYLVCTPDIKFEIGKVGKKCL